MNCHKCNKEIENHYLIVDSKKYHKECFTCFNCGKPISESYIRKSLVYYHADCCKDKYGLKCNVCDSLINSQYYKDEWGNVSHKEHNGIKVKFCDSCQKIIGKKTSNGGLKINGKLLCGYCRETIINTKDKVIPSLMSVKSILNFVGFKNMPQKIEIELKSQKAINEIAKNHSGRVQGLAQTSITTHLGTKQFTHKIFILDTLPKLEFEGVLAHELIHIWINQNEIVLTKQENEGMCELGAFLIYKNDPTNHGKLLLKRMNYNPDEIYGDGFRRMKMLLDSSSWKKIINRIRI